MATIESFDVLNILNDSDKVDLIQTLMGDDCLGSFFNNGITKLYFLKGLKNQVEKQLNKINIENTMRWNWGKLNKEDWHLNWQKNFYPVIIDKKLAVIPHWQKISPEKIVIIIKPGMAFGTGHHETTWLMLNQMIINIKSGMSVLDFGTGSGILSIAAQKLGAKHIDSIDNDIDCKQNFFENIKLNKISKGIHFHNTDVLKWNNLNYDFILANINKNIIEKLIPSLQLFQGTVLLSGLLQTDFHPIKKLCLKYHLKIKGTFIKGEWICINISSN